MKDNKTGNRQGKGRNTNNKFKNRAKQQARQGNYQDAAMDEEKFRGSKVSNDPAWYFKDKNILNSVASFSYNSGVGRRVDFAKAFPGSGNTVVKNAATASTISGIMSLDIAPVPGISKDAQDPLNLAAVNVYGYVRYKNSGSKNYDAPDLMLYLMAMDSIYACWNWLKRIYSVASTYSQLNTYQPKGYFAAENVDMDDILSNLADFRGWLNVKANEISAYCVPATMTYNVRHSWLFSNIYKDSDTSKAQEYMYVPSLFYAYDETTSPKGGKLSPIPTPGGSFWLPGTPAKLSDLKKILNDMLERLNYSEDIGIMSGDILKAYGESGLFTLSTFDADVKLEPVYNREVLTQIENATICTFNYADLPTFNIVQNPDTNFLTFAPHTTFDGNFTTENRFVNFHWDNPSPEDLVVATRLITSLGADLTPGEGVDLPVTTCGSEIVTSAHIVTWAEDVEIQTPGTGKPLKLIKTRLTYKFPYMGTDMLASDVRLVAYCWDVIAKMVQFDWAPMVPIGYQTERNVSGLLYGVLWDFDVYTVIDPENMAAINQMALLTEFNVPN